MKKIITCTGIGLFTMTAWAWPQTTIWGNVTSNQTWSGTVTVIGDVYISGGTVTVSPGTVVRFAPTNNNVINPNSDASHIHVIVNGNGGFTAVGNAADRILFTTDAVPQKNLWGGFDFEVLTYDTATTGFRYCDFEYGNTAADLHNYSGTNRSKVNFDHCTFRHMAAGGINLTSGGSSTITNCSFFDIGGPAIFSNACSTLVVSYCIIDSCASGIICVTGPQPYQTMTIDHVTIFHIDQQMHTGAAQTWDGDGLATVNSNPGGKVTLTNSIIQGTTKYGFAITQTNWTIANTYNAWFNCPLGALSVGTPGANSLENIDPLFVDTLQHDFRLKTGSPCIGQALDGTNMGCSQEVVSAINDMAVAGAPLFTLSAAPNPFTNRTIITVPPASAGTGDVTCAMYDLHGQMIKQLVTTAGHVVWDRTDNHGRRVGPGLYVFQVQRQQQCRQAAIMVTAR